MLLKQVVLIGAGNVAHHLGLRLMDSGITISMVFSRRRSRALELAERLHCQATDDLMDIPKLQYSLYLFAISDDAIASVAKRLLHLKSPDSIFAHTSGAASSRLLTDFFPTGGVFYPLQSFSRKRDIDFTQVPICVHAPYTKVLDTLNQLGERISDSVVVIDDEQRKVLHLAAVFVNNFSNHLFNIGKELVEANGLSFDLLRPLIAETAAKVQGNDPALMQTGPAIRGDQQSILSHLQYLQQYPDFQNLYRIFTHSIAQGGQQEK